MGFPRLPAGIWGFSLVSGISVPGGFYFLGAVVSVLFFWTFFVFMERAGLGP
jgi:hypothetical protein